MRQLWIDGVWQASRNGRARRIVNPATLEPVEEVAEADAGDVARAVEAARRAQGGWQATPAVERARILHEVAAALRADRKALAELLTREGGKPRIENIDEIEWCAACFDYYGELARHSHGSSIPPVAPHQVNFT
ncbi:MAG TPA: aldehyde dehydrogenase family protein, partial [Myxococcota bacterium]|nr:aldehyde dehydrogenase family protein [Myxococcota bacterium]